MAAAISLLVPERRWPAVSSRVVDLGLIGKVSIDSEVKVLRGFFEEGDTERPIADIARDSLVQQRLLQLQTVRSLVFDQWQPRIEVRGLEHLSDLQGKRGAIVWQLPFVFATLAGKMALMRAGFPLHHLSRFSHPFTDSRIGVHLINGIRCRPENRYLAERVLIERGQSPKKAIGRLGEILEQGGIVSIAVGAQARSTETFPFFRGSVILPHGPLKLAARCNVPILPTTTLLEDDTFVSTIEPPITTLAEMAEHLRKWTLRYPEQQVWRNSMFKGAAA